VLTLGSQQLSNNLGNKQGLKWLHKSTLQQGYTILLNNHLTLEKGRGKVKGNKQGRRGAQTTI